MDPVARRIVNAVLWFAMKGVVASYGEVEYILHLHSDGLTPKEQQHLRNTVTQMKECHQRMLLIHQRTKRHAS